ncbi:hypothetical protein [Streptomyces cavernicola]|uniref:DUF805 domain-containing protein n=1 Tax=Streptomyces cavernicola TaxID=3043613 RepID=A0ABT6SCE4_9ACTN|nr:hypothetical protein [Streptomyces sp. B-S-A6]MDI3405630.1 hypothetical protein [Streptomyces sp. B-S-A6]
MGDTDPLGETDPRRPAGWFRRAAARIRSALGGDRAQRSSAWLRRAASRIRDALTDDRLLVLLLLADLVTVLGASAIWLALGGDATTVGVTAGALLAFAAAMLPLIRRSDADGNRPLWPPFVLVVIPLAVLIVGLPALGAWAYLDSRAVDVKHRVTLAPEGPLKNGDRVNARVRADEPRPRLSITFAVTEHDPAAPVCVPSSELTVTLDAGSGKPQEQTGAADTGFTFDLGQGLTDVRLTIRLRAEQGCELDLSVASAQLDD